MGGGPRPRPGQRPRPGDRKNDPYATNEQIRAKEVRLVGDNVEQGVYPIDKARKLAAEMELDLIEISPNAEPPVCRILDYQKFLYQQKKRLKEQKQKATKVVVKAIGFLKEGSKVKAHVFFRGRSILFKDQGELLLLRFANDLEEYGKLEQMPVLEGKRMIIMLAPLKTKKELAEAKAKEGGKEEKGGKPAKEDKPRKEEKSDDAANAEA